MTPVIDRGQLDARLYESEERFRQAFEFAGIGKALVSLEGRWLKVNPAVLEILGYPEEELLGLTFQDLTHPGDLQADLDLVGELVRGERVSYQMEKRYFRKDGALTWCLLTVSLVRDERGRPLYFVSQIQDVNERHRSEQLLRESLRQKEAMLNEIHHRVNNNLQVINSILYLQARELDDAAARTAFQECQARIHAMAMVHEKLYLSKDFRSLDFADYLRGLARLSGPGPVDLELDPLLVDLDVAIPLSLLCHEVLSGGPLRICLRTGPAGFFLRIEGYAPRSGLSARLVERLARQLKAELTMGGCLELRWPAS